MKFVFIELQQEHNQYEERVEHEEGEHWFVSELFQVAGYASLFNAIFYRSSTNCGECKRFVLGCKILMTKCFGANDFAEFCVRK